MRKHKNSTNCVPILRLYLSPLSIGPCHFLYTISITPLPLIKEIVVVDANNATTMGYYRCRYWPVDSNMHAFTLQEKQVNTCNKHHSVTNITTLDY